MFALFIALSLRKQGLKCISMSFNFVVLILLFVLIMDLCFIFYFSFTNTTGNRYQKTGKYEFVCIHTVL